MAYNYAQFKQLIWETIRDFSLNEQHPELCAPSAVNLMLGTAAQESHFGTYFYQRGISFGKGGLGPFQMEKLTQHSIWDNELKYKPKRRNRLISLTGVDSSHNNYALVYNLRYAICIARYYYWIAPDPLPDAYDITGLGEYWNKWWNRNPEKGTVEEFIENWNRFCKA